MADEGPFQPSYCLLIYPDATIVFIVSPKRDRSKISSVCEPLSFLVHFDPKKASRMISAIGGGPTLLTVGYHRWATSGPLPPNLFVLSNDCSTNAFWFEEQEASAPSTSLCKHWSQRAANWQRQRHCVTTREFVPISLLYVHTSPKRARELSLSLCSSPAPLPQNAWNCNVNIALNNLVLALSDSELSIKCSFSLSFQALSFMRWR